MSDTHRIRNFRRVSSRTRRLNVRDYNDISRAVESRMGTLQPGGFVNGNLALDPPPRFTRIRRFELTSALAIGGSATALYVAYDGAAYTANQNMPFDVYDGLQGIEGSIGQRGYAFYAWDRGVWEIQQLIC